jgi:UDPglucose--hexose-1-phosphate uridylyltransferase
MRLYSKNKETQFEKLNSTELEHLAQALRITLAKLSSALDNPDYNFYIHVSPSTDDGKLISNAYRWHIEIAPRLSAIASFEFGTGVFINVVDPDEAATTLRAVIIE